MVSGKGAGAKLSESLYIDGQVGLGVDIVRLDRMQRILERTKSFPRRVFSEAERAYCDGTANPVAHYATRFAAKEAVLKALGTGFAKGVGPRDVEVRRTPKGKPYVVLTGKAREIAEEQGVREIPLSMSYTHVEAVACAIAITDSSEAAREARRDPVVEMTKQFKKMRSVLDEL